MTVGERAGADYRIADVSIDESLRPSFSTPGTASRFRSTARTTPINAAMAVAVAHAVFSLPFDEIALELGAAASGRWRMELLETDSGVTVLNDAYNANPTSMEAALVALGAPRSRRPVRAGSRCSATCASSAPTTTTRTARWGSGPPPLGLDVVVGVGAGGAAIADAARANGVETHVVADAAAAAALLDADAAAAATPCS